MSDTKTVPVINTENNLLSRIHQPAGPVYKNMCKQHAIECFEMNAILKGICSLCESHAPTSRHKTAYRYDKLLNSINDPNEKLSLNKDFVSFKCPEKLSDDQVQKLLNNVAQLPKEWTIVQITTQFNIEESTQINISKLYTDSLYISVFNCGQSIMKPFYITVSPPKDMNGDPIELCEEMKSIIDSNKNILQNLFGTQDLELITKKQKLLYSEQKHSLNSRIKDVVKQLAKNWLREWRCLLIGKFLDEKYIEDALSSINSKLHNNNYGFQYTVEKQYLLEKIVACAEYLSTKSLSKLIQYFIPDSKDLRTEIYKDILEVSSKYKFKNQKRHPLILIIDEKIDFFPWEVIDVLVDHPVSRMPSLHFAYALYKEHESTIVDGLKQISPQNGSFMINPGLDLKQMEKRLKAFFQYWLPNWSGIIGETPTPEQFIDCISNKDIFVYNGHGNGTQFCSAHKIQQIRVDSVVLLFGCSSIRMTPVGPFVEMYDQFHNYLIACSPCVVGMLWEVTDYDTDVLSTSIISTWIPSKSETHWRDVNKAEFWSTSKSGSKTKTNEVKQSNDPKWEPELLRAINIARKEQVQHLMKYAMVCRGLPVKVL